MNGIVKSLMILKNAFKSSKKGLNMHVFCRKNAIFAMFFRKNTIYGRKIFAHECRKSTIYGFV